jgi:hypothetical protein
VHDANQDNCCDLHTQTEFTDLDGDQPDKFQGNVGEITSFRVIMNGRVVNKYCCGDNSDFAPGPTAMSGDRCCAWSDRQAEVYARETEVCCPTGGTSFTSPAKTNKLNK